MSRRRKNSRGSEYEVNHNINAINYLHNFMDNLILTREEEENLMRRKNGKKNRYNISR